MENICNFKTVKTLIKHLEDSKNEFDISVKNNLILEDINNSMQQDNNNQYLGYLLCAYTLGYQQAKCEALKDLTIFQYIEEMKA